MSSNRKKNVPEISILDPIEAVVNALRNKEYLQINQISSTSTFTYIPDICAIIPDINKNHFGGHRARANRAQLEASMIKPGINIKFDFPTFFEARAMSKFYGHLVKTNSGITDYLIINDNSLNNFNLLNFNRGINKFSVETVTKSKLPKNTMCTLIPVYRLEESNKEDFNTFTLTEQAEKLLNNGYYPSCLSSSDINMVTNYIKNNKNTKAETEPMPSEQKKAPSPTSDKKVSLSDNEKLLVEADHRRFNYIKYEKSRLYDPMLGHWDLWKNEESGGSSIYKTSNGFFARDPRLDVHNDYVAAIDFGTSSTVVVIQGNTGEKIPLKIGNQNGADDDVKAYENPTFIEFLNIDSFMEEYFKVAGRPSTRFNDLAVSVNARNSMMSNKGYLNRFYTYFSELKQWADNQKYQPIVCDTTGAAKELKPFNDIAEGDLDPIEFYAYYIGMNINNMNRGICLDYLLSYPVTYEKSVCEKIRQSFERGIKKSLPIPVLEDEKIMKRFRVALTASEPASYAVCALQEYNIAPENGPVLYGVFDFGGGTSDYDYGIFEEEPDDTDRYDYRITRFQSVGDRYLGGENILERLAYEVYRSNYDKMKDRNIPFIKPAQMDSSVNESLISDNPTVSAKMNMFALKERLRPFWENIEEYNRDKNLNINDLQFFNSESLAVNDIKLDINYDTLENIIRTEIRKGVDNFFKGLTNAIEHIRKDYDLASFRNIYILLSGNSSRSPIVKEEFKSCIDAFCRKKIGSNEIVDLYKILPPLGTDESRNILEEIGQQSASAYSPNCKTGVAFGLLDCRLGGNIRFVTEKIGSDDDKIKFRFYVGKRSKKSMLPILSPNTDYDMWYPLVRADIEDFEVYYSESPADHNNMIPLTMSRCVRCRLDNADSEKTVYIRAVNSNTIEYISATEDELSKCTHGEEVVLE